MHRAWPWVLLISGSVIAPSMARGEESLETAGVLQIPSDRQASRDLEVAAAHLDRRDFARAEALLGALWVDDARRLAGDEVLLTSVNDRVRSLAARLPAEQQKNFWHRMQAATGQASETVNLGWPTQAGLLALERSAEQFKDAGNFELAAAAYLQAAKHPEASSADALRYDILRIDLLAELSGERIARDWLVTQPLGVRQQTIFVAEESLTVEAWLSRPRTTTTPQENFLSRPGLTPAWEWTGPPPGNLSAGLARAGEELRSHGLMKLSSVKPMVIGSRIITRTLAGLSCVNAESGKLIWELPNRKAGERVSLAGQQHNPLFSGKLFSTWNQQFQTNTLLGAISHDEATIYQVVESPTIEPAKPSGGYALEAVDVETGRLVWRTGGSSKPKDDSVREVDWRQPRTASSSDGKGISVCGPPLVLGNHLYLLAEQSAELMFLAVHRGTLEVDWSASIGQILPDASRAAPRTYVAAPLIWTGDTVICVTNCGAVAALDPLQRRVRWISRYPIELWSVGRLDPTSLDPSSAASLRTWREASVWTAGDRLVLASPESPLIHVLQAETGQPLLTIPRDGGVKLLSADGTRILVLESTAIRAIDAATGQLLWRTVLGEVQGTGVVTGPQVVQPLADGSVAVLSLDDGRRLPGPTGTGDIFGNLAYLTDGWLCGDEFRLKKFSDISQASADAEASPLQRAERHYAAGDFDAARHELTGLVDETAQTLLRAIDRSDLQHAPQRYTDIEAELLNRSPHAELKAEAYAALAEAAVRQQQWRDAVRFAIEGLDLDQTALWPQSGEPLRRVRADRVFQGVISQAWKQGDQTAIAELLSHRWQQVLEQPDPFAIQRLHQRWKTLEFSRGLLVDHAEQIYLGTSLMTRELSLLAAMHSLDDEPGMLIGWMLRDERRFSGFTRDASALERQFLTVAPGKAIDGKTVRQRLVDQGTDATALKQDLWKTDHGVWPDVPPRVTPMKDTTEDAYQTVVPVEAEPGSVWDRLDVTLDRQAQALRFTGDDQSGAWTLSVPRGNAQLQQYPLTYQAWGWGRMLLIRIGTQLAAVAPWNEQGEPSAKLIWSLDLLGAGAQLPEQLVIERVLSVSRRGHESFRIIDQYGRDVCLVGPVRPGYLCYLQQGKLVAIETETGQRLWERWDIVPGALIWGTDEHVILFDPDSQSYERLSARDGMTLAKLPCAVARGDIWQVAGGTIWTAKNDQELRLTGRDLVADRQLWERTFPQDCLPIGLDVSTGAVVDPRGALHLIDLQTGSTWDEPLTAEFPRPIERLILSRDESQFYLGVSGPAERSFEWTTTQPLNSYRRPLLHGPLLAIDRHSRRLVWTREFAGEPWLLDQNKSTPALVQIFKIPPPTNHQGIGDGVLRLISKRTGKDIFQHHDLNLLPYFSIQPQPDYQRFEVRTNNTLFDVDYDPKDAAAE